VGTWFFFFSLSFHGAFLSAGNIQKKSKIIFLRVDVSSHVFLGETNHVIASSSAEIKKSNQSRASGVKNKYPLSLTKPQDDDDDDNGVLLELTAMFPMEHSKKGTSLEGISTRTEQAIDENNLKQSESNYEGFKTTFSDPIALLGAAFIAIMISIYV
jgi:hypothetical protein